MDGWMYGRTCIAIRRILRFFLIENMPTNLTSRLELTSPPMRVRCPTYFSRIPRMNVYSFFSRVLIMYKSSAVLNSKEPLAPGLPIYSTCTVIIPRKETSESARYASHTGRSAGSTSCKG